MAKKNTLARNVLAEEEDFDFSDFMDDSYDDGHDEGMVSAMSGLIQMCNHQMQLAIELTKLAVEKSTIKEMNEEYVFDVFKKSSKVVAEQFPLKGLLDNFFNH